MIQQENIKVFTDYEITKMFFEGLDIKALSRRISRAEGIKQAEASKRVYQAIYNHYKENGFE